MLHSSNRRVADVPTLNATTGMAQGGRKGSWIDITSHFPGSIWLRGIDISFIDFFIVVFEYSSSKSLDIPFLNCAILPERTLLIRVHIPDLLRPLLLTFLFFYIPSLERFLFWRGGSRVETWQYYIIPVYSYSMLIRFAHSPVYSYGGWRATPING